MVALFAMVAWSIWEPRNRARVGQKMWGVDEVVQWASDLFKEFEGMHKKACRVVDQSEDLRWKPPDYGLYKINLDGALFVDQVCVGLWVVIRDWEGQIIVSLSRKVRYPGSFDLVEALAASRAISFAKDLSIHQMVVEGDSLWVIKAINDARLVRTMYGHVINDTRILSSIICCSFLDVKPKSNRLAHVLTHRAVVSVNTDMWLEDLSRDLVDVFQFDFL